MRQKQKESIRSGSRVSIYLEELPNLDIAFLEGLRLVEEMFEKEEEEPPLKYQARLADMIFHQGYNERSFEYVFEIVYGGV